VGDRKTRWGSGQNRGGNASSSIEASSCSKNQVQHESNMRRWQARRRKRAHDFKEANKARGWNVQKNCRVAQRYSREEHCRSRLSLLGKKAGKWCWGEKKSPLAQKHRMNLKNPRPIDERHRVQTLRKESRKPQNDSDRYEYGDDHAKTKGRRNPHKNN